MRKTPFISNPVALCLLLAWLPLLTTLTPLPSAANADLVSRAMTDVMATKETRDGLANLSGADRKSLEEGAHFWEDPKAVQSVMFRRWVASFLVISLGIVASTMAATNAPKWRVAVLASILLYFSLIFKASRSYVLSWENAQEWWLFATILPNGLFSLYKALLFPIILIASFVTLSILFMRQIYRRNTNVT